MNSKQHETLAIKAAVDNRNDAKPPLDFTFMCLTSLSGKLWFVPDSIKLWWLYNCSSKIHCPRDISWGQFFTKYVQVIKLKQVKNWALWIIIDIVVDYITQSIAHADIVLSWLA